jgi:nucleotide-binding universal stress UspA family protein
MATRARSILVGYDGSDASQRALEAAADLVGYGSVLAVAGSSTNVLNDARARLLRRQVTARYVEADGDLAATARTLEANLVVVDGRLGAQVIRRAPCDVLVVR